MATIPPTTGSTAATTQNQSSTKKAPDLLDKDAFLKLMMVELQHQDPLQPSDPSQYLNQLSQLTTLEQTTNMAASSAKTAAAESNAAALALLGHTVTYIDASGATQTGKVEKVQMADGSPTLTIAGVDGVAPSSVSEVS